MIMFGKFLADRGLVTPAELMEALDAQYASTPRLGKVALLSRALTVKQVWTILDEQCGTSELFGEVAVRLGFLTPETRDSLLLKQQQARPDLGGILVAAGVMTVSQLDSARRAYEPQAFEQEACSAASHVAMTAAGHELVDEAV